MRLNVSLRDYQKDLIDEALKHHEGMIVVSTGGGKTIIGLEIISRLGLTATVLVPNSVIQDQWTSECQKFFDYEPGVINGKKKEIKGVTVSTFASLHNNPELLKELSDHTSVLIVDEAHGALSDKRQKVLEAFKPKYLYGTTGTKQREDGKTEALDFYFSSTIAEFHLKQLQPKVEVLNSGSKIRPDEYHIMIEELTNDYGRNVLISGVATGESFGGRKVLVLTKRREHAKLLAGSIPGCHLIDSDDKGRNELLKRLKRGEEEFSCIVGTTSLLAVGTDIPALDTLVLACDMKGQVLTTQSVGRILRLFEGKPDPKIIDIMDGYGYDPMYQKHRVINPILFNQFKHRLKLYTSKGWEITGNYPDWLNR